MKNEILKLICEVYGVKYIGKLHVNELHPIGYEVTMELQSDEKPLYISAELEKDEFLKFFKEELRNRHLHSDEFYTGFKIDPMPVNHCYHD